MTNKYHYDPETCILYDSPLPGTVPYDEYNHALAEARKARSRMEQVTFTETTEIRCKVCGNPLSSLRERSGLPTELSSSSQSLNLLPTVAGDHIFQLGSL